MALKYINKKILIVGLGIGAVYKEQCDSLNYTAFTVDSNKDKNADFLTISDAINQEKEFWLSIICTPNYLHEQHVDEVLPYSKYVLVEKPGFIDVNTLMKYNNEQKKVFIVKNNLYRDILTNLKDFVLSNLEKSNIDSIHINWLNKNRVPYPGGWFTNKEKSFGGVSYDLLPHLIHFMYGLFGTNEIELISANKSQCWTFEDVVDTEYGSVNNINPIYDVDDHCIYEFYYKTQIILCADWKTDNIDYRSININFKDSSSLKYEYELCPNKYYGSMILDIMTENKMGYIFNSSYDESMLKLISLK